MRFSLALLAVVIGIAAAAPTPAKGQGNGVSTEDAIAALQASFDRNNPNGTPTNPGNPDDLNGDGVINLFEAGAQAS
jgi:hypothetical protein